MEILVIAEKPSVAARIADSIAEKQVKRLSIEGVSYYQIDQSNDTIYVVSAVGHLFTIRQLGNSRNYPVLDVEWAPSYEANKNSQYTKKYLDAIKQVAQKCTLFINACDYDIEGSVIGANVIKFVSKGDLNKLAKRMRFSTTTQSDLKTAYKNLTPLDINNFYAGETRHILDWLWGINFSRALMRAVSGRGFNMPMSIGRVQGPTLAILAKREVEITKFIPRPFWRITAMIKELEFVNELGDIFDQADAQKHFEIAKSSNIATVESVESTESMIKPQPPFDLTTLQLESNRAFRIDPSRTLAIAQSLYENAYISYPRTSSQKLPSNLGLQKIISDIAKNPAYKQLADALIAKKKFKPSEGDKTDEAHPAIFPTGVFASKLSEEEAKIYDMITKRFLSCFADYAKVARTKITVMIENERFVARGQRITHKGWMELYDYAKLEEKEIPEFKHNEKSSVDSLDLKELKTRPPKRYSKASLIAELEKRDLGTKATRAAIIDTLFRRKYVESSPIVVSKFGLSVYDALEQNCSMITDEETTRKLEKDMQEISKGSKKEKEVIEEGKKILIDALSTFDKNRSLIADSLAKGLRGDMTLGKCPTDGGELVVRISKIKKRFAACTNYPKCTQTYPLPQIGKIYATDKICEHCKTPIIKVSKNNNRYFEMDLDPNCITKKEWRERIEARMAQLSQKPLPQKLPLEDSKPAKPKKPKMQKPKKTKPKAKKKKVV